MDFFSFDFVFKFCFYLFRSLGVFGFVVFGFVVLSFSGNWFVCSFFGFGMFGLGCILRMWTGLGVFEFFELKEAP